MYAFRLIQNSQNNGTDEQYVGSQANSGPGRDCRVVPDASIIDRCCHEGRCWITRIWWLWRSIGAVQIEHADWSRWRSAFRDHRDKAIPICASVAYPTQACRFTVKCLFMSIYLIFPIRTISLQGHHEKKPESLLSLLFCCRSQRFSCVAWGKPSKEYPHGLIAGGMVDGSINIFDPQKILDGGSTALITNIKAHKETVNCVAFNPHPKMKHILASGGRCLRAIIYHIAYF